MTGALALLKAMLGSLRDLMPIVLVIAFFQLFVLQEPLPHLLSVLSGLVLVVLGLTFFIFGLEMGLFPIGESMAQAFARKGSLFWLLVFAFCLGFGTTIAEPALTAVAEEAAKVASQGGMIADTPLARHDYAQGLRVTVAVSVGLAIVIAVLTILRGWPIHYMLPSPHVRPLPLPAFAPEPITALAYHPAPPPPSTLTAPPPPA
ncbi:DUF1538 family protein, partial [Vibrio cholerae]|uniref:DUF1538 family protein n=1 Tax=Vibrio cholerae TaxID=666 RepID=UPI003D7EC13C